MSLNISQIYQNNPATTLNQDDLIYIGQYPYGTTNDSAIEYADLQNNIQITESQVTNLTSDLASKLNLSGGTMTGSLILTGNPTVANQAVNKGYVDSVASGISIQAAVQAASISNLNASYNNGSSGVGATLTNAGTQTAFIIDGYTAALNDSILIKNQISSFQNGVYNVTTLGSGSINWVLTRISTYNTPAQIKPGTLFAVNNGTKNINTSWLETGTVTTIGTSPVNFSLFSSNPGQFLQVANNLSDVQNIPTSVSNLGLTIGTNTQAWSATLDQLSSGSYTGSTSITTLGTVNSGAWQGTTIGSQFGGTGVNNGNSTITIGGNVSLSGAFSFSGILTDNTSLTFPSSGTLATTSQLPIGAPLTENNDTNITLTLGGSPNTSLLNPVSITAGWAGQLSMARGGTGANLIPSLGSLVYSGTTSLSLLAPSSVVNGILMSGGTAAPIWSSATYPSSTTINQLLYSSANNTISGLSTAANALLVTNGSGVPNFATTLPSSLQSNITTLGTISSGTWNGSIISSIYGGTGVNNGGNKFTFGGNVTFTGAFSYNATLTGNTNVTFPTSGTLATTSQIPGGAPLTTTNDTNVTLTLGGSSSAALVNSASIAAGWTGFLGLTRGGTGASLTASNGGIVYSSASSLAVLNGTATAGQVLLSGSSGAPNWSSAIYPSTVTAGQILYASSANTISGLSSNANSVVITNASSVPSLSTTLPAALNIPQPNIIGVTNGSSAAAGSVGEFLSSIVAAGSAVSLVNNVATNITSITLTPGDWDVWGNVTVNSTLGINDSFAWNSSISASRPDASLYAAFLAFGLANFQGASLNVPMFKYSVTVNTTVYLSAMALYTAGAATGCGCIFARRIR